MPKFYCYKCGHGTDYMYNKPKLCLKCGFKFFESSITQPVKFTPVKINNAPIVNNIIEPEENEFEETPKISSFAEKIEVEKNFETFSPKKSSVQKTNRRKIKASK